MAKKERKIEYLSLLAKMSDGKIYQVVTKPSTDKMILGVIIELEKNVRILDKPIEGALDDDKQYRYVGDVVGEMFTIKRGQKRINGVKCNVWIIVNDNPLGVKLKDRSKIELIDDKKIV